jgi:hypothetical protein
MEFETTVAIYRQAKVEAALRGGKLKDLTEGGLLLALATRPPPASRPSLGELMRPARGVVNSGISDLASHPEHLEGFGRDARHR